jgi:transposase InsO family protein
MIFPVVRELAADGVPVAVACRVLGVSTSGYYEAINRPPSRRDIDDAYLLDTIREIHDASRQTYGSPRVHAELRLGLGLAIGRKRVERLMRCCGLQGVHRRRWRRGRPAPAPVPDLVHRQFRADAPDRLWVTDITQHPTTEGWVYAAVVLDVFSRRAVGWAIADHLRTDLVVDALDMARWRRRPEPQQTILHSDRGTQYTSWLFGHRLREAGLLGSMGAVASAFDNALVESFFGSMQIELLDRRRWATRAELASAIFEWIEGFYNPRRRHSALGMLSPIDFEALHTAAETAA